jgi:hypothetical protein
LRFRRTTPGPESGGPPTPGDEATASVQEQPPRLLLPLIVQGDSHLAGAETPACTGLEHHANDASAPVPIVGR